MALTAVPVASAPPVRHAVDFTFVAAFLAILAVALVAQLLTLRWRRWFPGAESEPSLVGGVGAAVRSFMSLVI